MTRETERMQILDMIESGKINAEDGLALLQDLLSNQVEEDEDENEADETLFTASFSQDKPIANAPLQTQPPVAHNEQLNSKTENFGEDSQRKAPDFPEQIGESVTQPVLSFLVETQKWRRFWMIPFWVGTAILIISAGLMYWAIETNGIGVAFIFATLPFLLGLGIMLFSWQSRTSPWIHIRVTQAAGEKPERIALSFPLPIRPTLWFFRTFGGRIPKIQDISLDEILFAVEHASNPDNPIYIQVDEGDKGEKVEIYIG